MDLPAIPVSASVKAIFGDVLREEAELGQKIVGHILQGEVDILAAHLTEYPGAAELLKSYAGKLVAAAHLATPTVVQPGAGAPTAAK